MLYNDNSLSIGGTPLIKLGRIAAGAKATVLAKTEGRNPAYSVKCRIGAAMIRTRKRGRAATPGRGRGADQRQHGHRAGVCVRGPWLQADLDHAGDHEHRAPTRAGCIRRQPSAHARPRRNARRHPARGSLAAGEPERYFLPQQFKNPANPASTNRPPGRKSGTTPTAKSTSWSPE